jgi:hypothetical protein
VLALKAPPWQGLVRGALRLFFYGGNKPVAATIYRLDGLLLAAMIPDGPAHLRQTSAQARLSYGCLRPQMLKEFRFRHHPVPMLKEVDQRVKRLGL